MFVAMLFASYIYIQVYTWRHSATPLVTILHVETNMKLTVQPPCLAPDCVAILTESITITGINVCRIYYILYMLFVAIEFQDSKCLQNLLQLCFPFYYLFTHCADEPLPFLVSISCAPRTLICFSQATL